MEKNHILEELVHDDVLRIANAMINHGGSFVKKLGEALIYSDPINQRKIKDAFPEYWEEYKKWAIHDKEIKRKDDEVRGIIDG